jgi:3-deoxy-manno-octulosonate cytidylyltransferase (CMP-KDO synthetase)
VGLYAYRRDFLLHFVTLAQGEAERAEGLEQLRALEHGFRIRCAVIDGWQSVPVDVPADVARVEAALARR